MNLEKVNCKRKKAQIFYLLDLVNHRKVFIIWILLGIKIKEVSLYNTMNFLKMMEHITIMLIRIFYKRVKEFLTKMMKKNKRK